VVEIVPSGQESRLIITGMPMPVTYGRFEGRWVVDPSAEEEQWMDSVLTVIIGGENQEVGEERVYSVYKPGGAPVPADFVDEAIGNASEIAFEALKEMTAMGRRR
jgi:exosome complex RNA-binding protein Rrp42 (RNase PH superfamily)